jgi:hypothetical protein
MFKGVDMDERKILIDEIFLKINRRMRNKVKSKIAKKVDYILQKYDRDGFNKKNSAIFSVNFSVEVPVERISKVFGSK